MNAIVFMKEFDNLWVFWWLMKILRSRGSFDNIRRFKTSRMYFRFKVKTRRLYILKNGKQQDP